MCLGAISLCIMAEGKKDASTQFFETTMNEAAHEANFELTLLAIQLAFLRSCQIPHAMLFSDDSAVECHQRSLEI